MKKILGFAIGLIFIFQNVDGLAQANSSTLMTINGSDNVSLSEFEYIFKKNNPDTNNITDADLEEYLDLFVNFKLKVKEATELKMDTNPQFINELAGYRKQLAQPYLVDRKLTEQLINEAYERLHSDIRAKHILVKLPDNPTPKDTALAYNLAKDIWKKAQKQDFDGLMSAHKGKKVVNLEYIAEDLGYFTAFMMVYDFENAAFTTEIGKTSSIIKTRFGYHVLKVYDKRPARGEIQVAHIMVSSKEGDPQAEAKKKKIEELDTKIKAGEDFGQLAKQFSDDQGSAKNNGQLPMFGSGRMVQEFEDAAFALANNGDVSSPIKTQYGWHIIKRITKKELGTLDEMKNEVKSKISRDGRGAKSKDALLVSIKKEYGFMPNMKAVNEFDNVMDDSYKKANWSIESAKELKKTIFTLSTDKYGKSKVYTQQDFAKYLLLSQRRFINAEKSKYINTAFEEFVNKECIAFEDKLLEAKYTEFRSLMNEYRDGILLFDLMDKKVWNKAVKDTSGLKDFYSKNNTNYMWEQRCDASIYYCANTEVAATANKLAKKQVKKNYTDQYIMDEVNVDSQLNLKMESAKYLKGDNALIDQIDWVAGMSGNIDVEGQVAFVNVKYVLTPMPKELKEARGIITADYQKYLEEEWIKELKAKYPIEINKAVLSQIK